MGTWLRKETHKHPLNVSREGSPHPHTRSCSAPQEVKDVCPKLKARPHHEIGQLTRSEQARVDMAESISLHFHMDECCWAYNLCLDERQISSIII